MRRRLPVLPDTPAVVAQEEQDIPLMKARPPREKELDVRPRARTREGGANVNRGVYAVLHSKGNRTHEKGVGNALVLRVCTDADRVDSRSVPE